jgi:hypothetical protein
MKPDDFNWQNILECAGGALIAASFTLAHSMDPQRDSKREFRQRGFPELVIFVQAVETKAKKLVRIKLFAFTVSAIPLEWH